MENSVSEASYPYNFRISDSRVLGEHLKFRNSVELVGMKHVGIGNFLSFFLNHKEVVNRYINHGEKHLFIPVDLNDLVEREIYPFWILTFKRVVDSADTGEIRPVDKKEISDLFLDSIQSHDLFLTIENLRKAINLIVNNGVLPTIFLLRLDRLKEVFNEEFFGNLQGLVDATGQKLAYVFTSWRSLGEIASPLFEKKYLTLFSHKLYIKPAQEHDAKIIFGTFLKKYDLELDPKILRRVLFLCMGHVQSLQLSLIILNSKMKEEKIKINDLLAMIAQDERVNLLSEEIWESLTPSEQEVLAKIRKGKRVTDAEKRSSLYLWDTEIVKAKNGQSSIFNPLFEYYLTGMDFKSNVDETVDFTKKENLLFSLLSENRGEICEREKIIKTVWPEYEEVGISDWAIDRLVSRLRAKLRRQESKFQIVTVKTRGYKLVEELVTKSF